MSKQKENAEIIQEVIRSAMKIDAVLRDIYKDINLEIRDEKDGSCIVNISAVGCARCYADGSVTLLNHPDSQPYVGEVPVMQPVDRDSFLLAMLYLGDLNALYVARKARMDRLTGRDSSPKKGYDDFGPTGFGGPSGGMLS
jgi:hypothetical protein